MGQDSSVQLGSVYIYIIGLMSIVLLHGATTFHLFKGFDHFLHRMNFLGSIHIEIRIVQ